LLDIRGIAIFADYFVICTGTSDRMLQALADAAVEWVNKTYDFRGRREGTALDGWVLVDFGDVILHLLSPEKRHYYDLEELWSRGKVMLHLQ
jgi:ribosome-associated protein